MENVLSPLAKSVLILLGLIAAASVTDVAILKKLFGLGTTAIRCKKSTTLFWFFFVFPI